jgi:uncharacterized protein with FMN-binding domain
MIKHQTESGFNLGNATKKFYISAFVVITFIAYVIHQRFTNPDSALNPASQLSTSSSQTVYKDGTYTGPQVDAYYGLVEVQVQIQQGKIANVQFLQYPNDRNTSVRINSIAMPYLEQEAIQAQSAQVNIISGATLTSEGFMMSLDAALKSAKS